MPQSFGALYCHFIFSTKHREPLIAPDLQPELFAYLGGILRDTGNCLLAAGGIPDHVHLLVSMSREASVAGIIRDLKANSSSWIHQTRPTLRAFAWQNGYGAFSVSYSALDAVKDYLARQDEHHLKKTFKEEFILFLERHAIEYDERYLWD